MIPADLITQLDGLFYPKSVAIVGLPRGLKTGKLFLISLLDLGYSGAIYPVNPTTKEIDGLKAFASVSAIPASVDLAIVLVPHHQALPIVKECAAKGVKGVVLFTAGYKETGTPEGLNLEKEIVSVARAAGMRLFGPNCMGLYCPESGLSFFPELSREPGPVGFISHSGSLGNILGRLAGTKGIRFSKVASLGNEADVHSADLLAYLGHDSKTRVIGAYLEGIKDGPYFLKALREASLEKPVILWKMGLTDSGQQAAASHTGAMAGLAEIWPAVVRQTGAISVHGFEALVDHLMGFALLPQSLGDRVAILSGPGGLAVATAEACGREGLRLADLASSTRTYLAKFVPATGTSLRNPVDVGLSASLEIDIYLKAAQALALDPGVDVVVVVGAGLSPELNRYYTEGLIRIRTETNTPFLIVAIPGFDLNLAQIFCQNGLPFFDSAERAMAVYSRVRRYQLWRQARNKTIVQGLYP